MQVRAPVLALEEALSFWGGVSAETGDIIEPGHPQYGSSVNGVLLGLPHGRGSSSAASVLAEVLRIGKGPAGIILEEPDSILLIGALVAEELYGVACPVVVGDIPPTGTIATLLDDGTIRTEND